MSIRQRVLQYLQFKDISKYQFYKITGLSNGFLDKGDSISSENCVLICNHFTDLNAEWLLLGRGKMLVDSEFPELNKIENEIQILENILENVKYIVDENKSLKSENISLREQISEYTPRRRSVRNAD